MSQDNQAVYFKCPLCKKISGAIPELAYKDTMSCLFCGTLLRRENIVKTKSVPDRKDELLDQHLGNDITKPRDLSRNSNDNFSKEEQDEILRECGIEPEQARKKHLKETKEKKKR